MKRNLLFKVLAVVWAVSGVVILTGVFWPILSYREKGVKSENEAPVNSELDYTKASNWFYGGAEKEDFYSSKISFYNLSIPKLKIEGAVVAIGGEDLSKSLIQYPGTAVPGKPGNTVIFGHSILPIFYTPKDYLAIFSTLPTLKEGDEIIVNYDGVTYKYLVEAAFDVYPTDIQILQQDKSDSFLTLVTCVPPGDPRKPKRRIVRARVVPPDHAYAPIGN
ncbi:MAG: sortase [bacterium]|nr:sortase [bacterium]